MAETPLSPGLSRKRERQCTFEAAIRPDLIAL